MLLPTKVGILVGFFARVVLGFFSRTRFLGYAVGIARNLPPLRPDFSCKV